MQAKVRLQAKQAPEPIAEHTSGKDEHSFAAVAAAADGSASQAAAAAAPAHATRLPSKGAVQLLSDVYKEKGLAGWYQGLGAQIVKAVLCQGALPLSLPPARGWPIVSELGGGQRGVEQKEAWTAGAGPGR